MGKRGFILLINYFQHFIFCRFVLFGFDQTCKRASRLLQSANPIGLKVEIMKDYSKTLTSQVQKL